MIEQQVTSADELAQKIKANRYNFFTLPVLEVTVQYRNPDLLKLSFNHKLPSILAERVIAAYKASVSGKQNEYEAETKDEQIEITSETAEELIPKGYELLKELVTSHKILDVPESDPVNDIISWKDIPEGDALAFLFKLVTDVSASATKNGGETSLEEVETFPNRKRSTKRRVASANGQTLPS